MKQPRLNLTTIFWIEWFICSLILAAIISEGIGLAYLNMPLLSLWPPFLWCMQHSWIFIFMWILLTLYKVVLPNFLFSTDRK